MSLKLLLKEILAKQKINVKNFLHYRTLYFSHHSSRTLGKDDVRLAKKWLKQKDKWLDDSYVKKYETEFAEWNGSKHAFAYMSGREALSASIYALDLQPGDEVILPAYTCVVVPNAFKFAGVKIQYADIELDTYGLDIESVKDAIGPDTKAILVHHLYGLVSRDFEKIIKLAQSSGIKIIEDCAHTTGAFYQGRRVGNFGDVAFYSSEQSKVFNTVQGGLVTTNDEEIRTRLEEHYSKAAVPDDEWVERQLFTLILYYYKFKHPQRYWLEPLYEHSLGEKKLISTTKGELKQQKPLYYGRRMTTPVAAIGSNQLKKIDKLNRERRSNAQHWKVWCAENGYPSPIVIEDSVPVWLRFPVLVEPEKKQNTEWARKALGVELGVWFVSHLHPSNIDIEGSYPNSKKAINQCVNLPTL